MNELNMQRDDITRKKIEKMERKNQEKPYNSNEQ